MELKTKLTDASVDAFLAALESDARRADCAVVSELMQAATGAEPKLWGTSIVGFGLYPVKYANGKEASWPRIAFAPRKQHVTLYLNGIKERTDLLQKLGKHKMSGGCLHIKKLADVDIEILKELIAVGVAATR